MKKFVQMFLALIGGLGAAASVFSTPIFSRPNGSDLSRMRADVERVGASMRGVIEREDERKIAQKSR